MGEKKEKKETKEEHVPIVLQRVIKELKEKK